MQQLIASGRDEIFLGEEFKRIGDQRVYQAHSCKAENRGPVGADPILDQRAAFPFHPTQNASQVKNHEENEKCFDGNNREIDDHDAPPAPLSNSIP